MLQSVVLRVVTPFRREISRPSSESEDENFGNHMHTTRGQNTTDLLPAMVTRETVTTIAGTTLHSKVQAPNTICRTRKELGPL
jgi:hypothetical protein